jgi:hypothetical protein
MTNQLLREGDFSYLKKFLQKKGFVGCLIFNITPIAVKFGKTYQTEKHKKDFNYC